ncbi:MAG: ATP-binding protein [Cellulomonas sp.]|uniref:ATP-binding protein n=1 Tax=Cellulomonas sp. TaxID=40001 RepID=UPI0019EE318C|nr:ATP-binding protein [Cellulomonas sp.]MBF0688180.1 ATP-binding protein [Cellulomonas sp.]
MTRPSGPPADDSPDLDGGLRSSRPPARFTPVRTWVLDNVSDLHAFRQQLRTEINTRSDVPAEEVLGTVAHDLVLVASELATNGIRHGRPPTTVELLQDGPEFLLTVADHDLGSVPRVAGERPPGDGGFGLQIARRLAREVGWYRTDSVKVIWAELGP